MGELGLCIYIGYLILTRDKQSLYLHGEDLYVYNQSSYVLLFSFLVHV